MTTSTCGNWPVPYADAVSAVQAMVSDHTGDNKNQQRVPKEKGQNIFLDPSETLSALSQNPESNPEDCEHPKNIKTFCFNRTIKRAAFDSKWFIL